MKHRRSVNGERDGGSQEQVNVAEKTMRQRILEGSFGMSGSSGRVSIEKGGETGWSKSVVAHSNPEVVSAATQEKRSQGEEQAAPHKAAVEDCAPAKAAQV